MAHTPWQRRIRRAEHLAGKHSFAAEILGFYVHVARFQEGLYQRLERGGTGPAQVSGADTLDLPELGSNFPSFLAMVKQRGPSLLAQVAGDLHSGPQGAWFDPLNSCWSGAGEPPSSPEEFLAFAFLQPYGEFARSRSQVQLEGYSHPLCPFCSRKPLLAVLRPQGDGGRRSLVCGFCLTEWEFRRIVCAGCGQEDHAKLPVYTAESFPYIRVECCDTCQTYIKSIDMTKNGLAEPLVDELASVPLSLWAEEREYSKLHPNLLGM